MVVSIACLILQRFVVPAVLVLAALARPVGISFVYLLMFFISPFIPIATNRNFKGSVTAYFLILIALSTILIICHIALQVTIISLNIDTLFGSCSFEEQLLRHIGFIDFRRLKEIAIVEWLAPEVIAFITSLVVYLVLKKLTAQPDQEVGLENGEVEVVRTSDGIRIRESDPSVLELPIEINFDGLIRISPLFCLATLFFAAVLRPSVPGGFYLLIFLLAGSYWATCQSLQRGFALLLRFVMVVIVAHTLCIVAYQTKWMQGYLDSKSLTARLIGLEPLVTSECKPDIRYIIYDTNYKADSFLNPIVLLFSYYALALTTKNLIDIGTVSKPLNALGQQLENGSNKFNRQLSRMTHTASRSSKKDSWSKTQRLNVSLRREHRPMITEPTETTPLVRNKSRNVDPADIPSTLIQDITLDDRKSVEDLNSSLCDQICYGIVSIGGFIYQNSYIFTNILMMAWSIVYHSWLTFVLLLWANVLWMIPNQRKAMMRSSPFIAIYAELLIIAQYIYGMDLTNEELPARVATTGINLEQIGLSRPQEYNVQPSTPLIVKTAFLLMFWVTSRQFFKEQTEKRLSEITDIVTPLPLQAIGTSASADQVDSKKTSKFLKKTGDIIKNLLVRLWMWLLVLVIFLCAITGHHMTGFRIFYMALFLFFLLVFQTSSRVWVKVMYGFWLFLIFYAMSMLILIYTYQFDKFDEYWHDYLNISKTLQSDIGLEQYKTKDLFLHLVAPTVIVILTVIQVHYFHKRFIASLQQTGRQPESHRPQRRALSKVVATTGSRESIVLPDLDSVRDLLRLFLKRAAKITKQLLKNFRNAFWRFLEIHIIKAVYIAAFVCAVSEICVLHIFFVALCLLGIISRLSVQTFISRIISFVVTLIILTKMIYQIAYLDHRQYDVRCPNDNETNNNALWFGLEKASAATGLIGLIRKYIIYMVMVTLHAVVSLRQHQMRAIYGEPTTDVKLLFPGVTRTDAEKNLEYMTKYLFNYCFYKFGVEISLITLVATITYRQDVVAVGQAVWLFVLLLCSRNQKARIWGVLQWFVGISLFLQYLVLVGFPPGLCLEYPWSGSPYSDSIQRWAMLPGHLNYDHSSKLIFDFVLLLMLNRQKRIFHVEKLNINKEYPGGSNGSVVHDISNLGKVRFENPTHDFLSKTRNYLDIFKYVTLCGFYWVTLAVVFLAGTNIADLLALGYLIGAFVFLWEGSDFYLRNIHVIIKRWKWLIYYNVANIVIKTCLQMAGCLFMEQLRRNCCWLVHMLGITCASKISMKVPQDEVIVSGKCPATAVQVVLLWDSICFAFLILQLRIFKSHYFCHIINDTKANSILASRGAEIIEELRVKQINHRQEHENEVLLKIKRKMERIRATQQKMLRPIDKPTHFDECEEEQEAEGVLVSKALVAKVAPLAHQSSFSSCQGSGYHTPDDDDESSEAGSMSHSSGSSSSSSSTVSIAETSDDRAQLLDCIVDSTEQQAEPQLNVQGIQIEYDDVVSDMHTDYADVNSVSDVAAGDTMGRVARLQLPEIDIQFNTQPNTPSSDLTTIPLDGFLDVQRLSMGSAPNSDMVMPLREDSEESYEVFSPPPYDTVPQQLPMHTLLPPLHGAPTSCSLSVNVSGGSSVISSNLTASGAVTGRAHRRQSSVNAVSWNETVSIKCTPKEHTPSGGEESEEVPVTMRQRSLHRRHLSMGNATYTMDERSTLQDGNRRYSNVSWARAETKMRATARPHSWGPVGTAYYLESLMLDTAEATLHGQSVRAGDYYMFDDMDDKFELDMIDDATDFLDDQEHITDADKKLNRRKTLINVWKDIQSAEMRRKSYMRQRSYASAPGSHIGMKIDEDLDADAPVGVRTSTHSEPVDYAHRSTSEYFTTPDRPMTEEPSTSQEAPKPEEPVEPKKKPQEVLDSSAEITEKDSDDSMDANPIVRLLEAFLVSLTIRLNRFSRNYRYVNKILAEEKKVLKETQNMHRLGRPGAYAMFAVMKKNIESDEHEDAAAAPSSSSTRTSQNALNNTDMPQNDTNANNTIQSQSQEPQVVDIIEMPLDTVDASNARHEAGSTSSLQQKGRKLEGIPEIRIRAPSFDRCQDGSGLLSKQWSYDKLESIDNYALYEDDDFAARDHNIIIEMLIATWYALLSNTDLICYIVVFINQVVNASIISLPLPLMVFLWGTLSLPRPTKTFWVTLIACTQANVLIKCIFQFKLIWAKYIDLPNQPLTAAKMFGVQMDPNYASYDLLLLLVLFFHRFILKSQGLWKSEYKKVLSIKRLQEKTFDEEDNESVADPSTAIVEKTPVVEGFTKKSDDPEKDEVDEEGIDEERPQVRSGGTSLASSDKVSSNIKKRIRRARYFSSVRKFFRNLVHKPRLPSDVYALMFLCDFVNFFVLLFGFTAFGSQQTEGDGGVQTYLAENKVPVPFLIMLLVQFILIVIDRALYLRKALVNKIIFHFFSVVGIHIWMFFIVPAVTERSFYKLAPPIIFYIIKCFYLLLSSYQIKCGYPKRILGNFLTKGFSLANMISFRVYMQIPFLYELRTILDWVCTDTTMTLFDWLKMEDIFSEIYFIKCSRQMETDFPAIRADKKSLISKLILGGSIILIIVISIWGPLCLFALGNAVGQSNIPYEVNVKVRLGSYDPLYETITRESVIGFSPKEFDAMTDAYSLNRSAYTFLAGYDANDIAAIKLPGNSPSMWRISPPDKQRLITDLKNDVPLLTRFTYSLTRIPPSKNLFGTVGTEITYMMEEDFPDRKILLDILEARVEDGNFTIPSLIPKFIKVLNSADPAMVHALVEEDKPEEVYQAIVLKMHGSGNDLWWEIAESCQGTLYNSTLWKLPYYDCTSGIVMYTFNDKKFPSTFSFLTAGGIIGLYTTFVLIASRFLKSFIAGQNRKIMFEDLPYVDRVLQLCLDIYLVREALEFALEEDLFAKLIFLYRSPETMIKWTRPKEDNADDETDTESLRSRQSGRRPEQALPQQS